MAHFNDPDTEAFFRQGDDGTYSGGPGDSIPTGVVSSFDDLEEEALPRVTLAQIKRRDRYTRWVTGVVSVLGAAAVLAFVVRAVATRDDGTSGTTVTRAEQTPTAAAERSPNEATAAAPETASPAIEAIVPVHAPNPPAEIAPPAEDARPPAPAPAVEQPRATKRSADAEPSKSVRKTERPTERSSGASNGRTVLPAPKAPFVPSTYGHSSPPTANFPD